MCSPFWPTGARSPDPRTMTGRLSPLGRPVHLSTPTIIRIFEFVYSTRYHGSAGTGPEKHSTPPPLSRSALYRLRARPTRQLIAVRQAPAEPLQPRLRTARTYFQAIDSAASCVRAPLRRNHLPDHSPGFSSPTSGYGRPRVTAKASGRAVGTAHTEGPFPNWHL